MIRVNLLKPSLRAWLGYRAGVIYAVLDEVSGLIKIGFTCGCPYQRLISGGNFNPNPMRLLGYFDGSREGERAVHRKFGAQRQFREWFQSSPELLSFFAHKSPALDDAKARTTSWAFRRLDQRAMYGAGA